MSGGTVEAGVGGVLMAGYRIKLDNDIQLPVPFDLLYCGRRETITESALLRLTPDYGNNPAMLGHNRLRLYVNGSLTHEGGVLGSAQLGEIRKTEAGKFELWLDPRYVNRVGQAAHGR